MLCGVCGTQSMPDYGAKWRPEMANRKWHEANIGLIISFSFPYDVNCPHTPSICHLGHVCQRLISLVCDEAGFRATFLLDY